MIWRTDFFIVCVLFVSSWVFWGLPPPTMRDGTMDSIHSIGFDSFIRLESIHPSRNVRSFFL
eukprot:jgi/Psemu1/309756/fgenesh1_kg.553_\